MRAKHWLVAICLFMFVTSVAAGAFAGRSYDARVTIYAGAAWPLYILIYCWMKADSRERYVTPPPGAAPLIIGFPAVAIPYYLLGTRQRWRKLSSLALFGTYVVLAAACSVAGELLGGTIASA